MASYYSYITQEQAALIHQSRLFFMASVDPNLGVGPHDIGPVNLSPKGGVPLHILNPQKVAFLDYVGSGNETARHAQVSAPTTLMVCSFEEENAAIVRLYGQASVTPLADSPLGQLLLRHPAAELKSPPRQVVELAVMRTATSCGYGVPVMSFIRDRQVADRGRDYKEARLSSSTNQSRATDAQPEN